MLTKLGVVRVELFELVFPFSRESMAKTLVVLTNLRLTTDLKENGQKVFSPPRDEKTRKPVQKSYEHMYRV